MLSVIFRAPPLEGENVRTLVQVPAGATVPLAVQVPPLRAKSALFVPVRVKKGFARFSVPDPLLVTVTVNPPLVVPTF